MRKKMERLAKCLNPRVMYFTEHPINIGGYEGYRYFIVWQNTHSIHRAYKTQREAIEGLEELLREGEVQVGAHSFLVRGR